MANKHRLIDANALMQRVVEIQASDKSPEARVGEIIIAISDAPTVDAVEVVRCKDCRHRRRYVFPFSDQTYTKCKIWDGIPRPDDFCSYGERRNDG